METTNNTTAFLWRQPPPQAEFVATAETYDVPATTAAAAWRNLATGQAAGIAFSGKLASGKDTVAPLLLARLGVTDPAWVGFSHPLKQEITELIGIVLHAAFVLRRKGAPDAAGLIVERFDVDADSARTVADLLWDELRKDGNRLTGWSRTETIRAVLQFWGTEVRRAADPLFWVRKRHVRFTTC